MPRAVQFKPTPTALRVRQVAEMIGLPAAKVRQLIREGRLYAKRVDNLYLVPVAGIEKFLGL